LFSTSMLEDTSQGILKSITSDPKLGLALRDADELKGRGFRTGVVRSDLGQVFYFMLVYIRTKKMDQFN
jgi:hypothetical protein